MKRYLLIFAVLLTGGVSNAQDSKFAELSLPHGVRIKVPMNWWILSGELNTSIETAGEAALELSGLEIPLHKETLLFRANSMPRTTYAGISITAADAEFTSAELSQTTPEELKEATPIIKDAMAKMLKPGGFVLESFEPLEIAKVGDNYGMVISYQRSGPKGSVVVRILRMVVTDKEITVQMSYRKNETALWKPVTDYMRSTLQIKK